MYCIAISEELSRPDESLCVLKTVKTHCFGRNFFPCNYHGWVHSMMRASEIGQDIALGFQCSGATFAVGALPFKSNLIKVGIYSIL